MKLTKIAVIVILLPFLVILWNQWSFPEKWNHVLYPLEHKDAITAASKRYSLDPYLITAIIYEESKFNPSSKSNVGAIGLMQIMPDTGRWIAGKQGRRFSVDDLYDPETNIDMGSWYFKYLRNKYEDERLALAAYNSGDKNVDRWLKAKNYRTIGEMVANIPFKETRHFVQKVLRTKNTYETLYAGEFSEPAEY